MSDLAAPGSLVGGRYVLDHRIDVQGWGSLWVARDQTTHRACSVRLGDVATHRRAELAVRYRGELEAATQIRCDNVVDMFDQGEWNGIPYLVMERIEGEVLSERLLRERPLDPWTAYRIVAQVACALSRAHGAGVVHRDLDPDHVFLVRVGKQETAKVFDFGVMQAADEWALDRATKLGSTLALPFYASPERAGGLALDWRSDLWSLAIIAYECLTGTRPFESESLGDLLARILHEPIPGLTCPTLGPSLPLERWWQKASTRDPKQRFPTAKELADELGAALRLPILRVPALRPMRSGEYAAVRLPEPANPSGPDQPHEPPSRAELEEELVATNWRWLGFAVAALALLVVVFLALSWLRRYEPERSLTTAAPSASELPAAVSAPSPLPPAASDLPAAKPAPVPPVVTVPRPENPVRVAPRHGPDYGI